MVDVTAAEVKDRLGTDVCDVRLAIWLLLSVGFLLRLIFLAGPIASDDTRYLAYADRFLTLSRFSTLDHAGGRLLFLLLVGWPVKLFGHAVYGALANVVYATMLDLLVVWFCLRELGKHAALIATLVLVANPIAILFSGMILPDLTLAFFLLAAGIALHEAGRTTRPGQRYRWVALSGWLACLAYMCKDPGVLMLPVGGSMLLFGAPRLPLRERVVGLFCFAGAFSAMFVIDGCVYLAYTGDFLYKIHATAACHNAGIPSLGPWDFLLHTTRGFLEKMEDGGAYLVPVLLGIPAMTLSLFFCPAYRLFAATGLFVLSFLFFGSSSLTQLLPLPFQLRYLHPILPFVAISGATLAHRFQLSIHPRARIAVPLLCLAVLFTSTAAVVVERAGTYYRAPWMKSVGVAVESLRGEGKPFFVDERTLSHLPHFLSRESLSRVTLVPEKGELPAGFYLFDPRTPSLSRQRIEEIARLKVRSQIALDWRTSNAFRSRSTYKTQHPPVIVYEK